MRTVDFEKAIEAMECEVLRISYKASSGGAVIAAYGQKRGQLTYLMWDETGRAFVYDQADDAENCVSEYNLGSLPYERDARFDLKFE